MVRYAISLPRVLAVAGIIGDDYEVKRAARRTDRRQGPQQLLPRCREVTPLIPTI
jgi:hypothetical protein